MGAAIALAVLDAMTPGLCGHRPAPLRMAFLYVPNGIVMDEWTPKGQALGVAPLPEELPRITRALAPYRNDMMVLSGLTSNGGRALGDGPGDHGRAGAAYLTGVHPRKTYGKDIQAGVSMDQVAAQKLEGATRFASLELGCEEGVQGGNCDNGYSCAYSNSISWRTPSSPMPPEIRPRAVFERLFGNVETERDPKRRARQELYQKSVLDVVLEDARRLQGSLGGADRRKLDEYLYGIREIETRIQKTEREHAAVTPTAAAPSPSIPTDFAEHARIMMDLLDAGVPDRFDAGGDGVAGHRAESAIVRCGDRDLRSAPRPDAPQRGSREDREGHEDQLLSHPAVHLSARTSSKR